MSNASADYSPWIGASECQDDAMDPQQARGAAAMWDLPTDAQRVGAPLHPLWHWFYFRSVTPQHTLAADGHAVRGDFLPPVALPRRMIAGGRVTFHHPLVLGVPAVREREVTDVRAKEGRSGPLVFVRVQSRIWQDERMCVDEEQEIVYRERSAPEPLPVHSAWPAVPDGALARELTADTRLLFRFSALTFNAHRIHYDRDYTREEEGYPGLLVHGPLLAMWLLAHACAHAGVSPLEARDFTYRSERPAYDGGALRLVAEGSGDTRRAQVLRADGLVAQSAVITLA